MTRTYQQMFDRSYLGVIRQGGPSLRADGNACVYRGQKGRKCGIGHLIPDKLYTPDIESKSISVLDCHSLGLPSLPEDVVFLGLLQGSHDRAASIAPFYIDAPRFIAEFKDDMRRLAVRYDLTVPEEEQDVLPNQS